MKIYKSNERFSYALTSKKEWIPFVTFNSLYQMEIIDSYKQVRLANHKALKLLKTFNDNIIAVNIKTESYKVRTRDKVVTLPFTRLSHGERLFMICLMADSTGKDVYVSGEVTQLDKGKLIKFAKDYGMSRYIHVVPTQDDMGLLLKTLVMKYHNLDEEGHKKC